ncbi:hypothetical protein [Brachybacterium nesterenkovii]|uniref:hypothetical protein n=1 Tax=Brachybacterium nesterenkovii TaxID=47847 RepID=UPI00321BA997
MAQSRLAARLDDGTTGRSLTFPRAEAVILAHSPDEVPDALAAVEAAARGGSWAVGHIAYEAAAGLHPDAVVRAPDPNRPLLEPRPLTERGGPARLAIDDPASGGVPIDPADPRVRHKTSDRAHLEAARWRQRKRTMSCS